MIINYVHLAEQKVQTLLHEHLDLLGELCLDCLLGLAGEVGGALGDPAQHQGVPLGRHLLGDPARLPVDGLHPDLHPRLVAAAHQLVLCRVISEGLNNEIARLRTSTFDSVGG